MVRPRWHDILIVVAIFGVALVGIWALWWDDVLGYMGWGPGSGSGSGSATVPPGNV